MPPSSAGSGDDRKERLLVALAECSAAKGLDATSISDIAEAAGVLRDTFYEFFEDKEECLSAAMESLLSETMETIAAAQALHEPGPSGSATVSPPYSSCSPVARPSSA